MKTIKDLQLVQVVTDGDDNFAEVVAAYRCWRGITKEYRSIIPSIKHIEAEVVADFWECVI